MATSTQNPDGPSTGTTTLASTEKVRGLAVYGRDGDRLGTISELILNKRSGQTAYVILTSGGFLGLGQAYHPIPWPVFRYDENLDGYVIPVDKRLLDGAPSYRPDSAPIFDDAYGRRVTEYYRSPTPNSAS